MILFFVSFPFPFSCFLSAKETTGFPGICSRQISELLISGNICCRIVLAEAIKNKNVMH